MNESLPPSEGVPSHNQHLHDQFYTIINQLADEPIIVVDIHPDVEPKNNTIVRIHVLPEGRRTIGEWQAILFGTLFMIALLSVMAASAFWLVTRLLGL